MNQLPKILPTEHISKGSVVRFPVSPLEFQRLGISCFQIAILVWLKYCYWDVNPQTPIGRMISPAKQGNRSIFRVTDEIKSTHHRQPLSHWSHFLLSYDQTIFLYTLSHPAKRDDKSLRLFLWPTHTVQDCWRELNQYRILTTQISLLHRPLSTNWRQGSLIYSALYQINPLIDWQIRRTEQPW